MRIAAPNLFLCSLCGRFGDVASRRAPVDKTKVNGWICADCGDAADRRAKTKNLNDRMERMRERMEREKARNASKTSREYGG